MNIYHEILEKYWGYTSFRPLQEDIIRSVCEGRDTLGLMPTGGGKSITFQVPAMAMEGICIVVTPLIALMKDQVDNLRRNGIKAATVYTGMSRHEIITQLENCIFGNYKFLYVSPERLGTDIFRSKLAAMNVCLLVVDESHCISQWGYDFRPSYLKIAEIRKDLPDVPILALTATATADVVDDIQTKLQFRQKNVFQKSFHRSNLAYYVRRSENKMATLERLLKHVSGTAIVYVRSRKRTKEISITLEQMGFSCDYFHAGLNREEKNIRQNRWKNNERRIIVATNAFGMGIDKPDVRLVVHIDMPGSIEEYFQEAGRAGRDEQKAYAVALCSGADNAKLKKRLADEYPEKELIARVYEALGNYFQIAVGFGFETIHDFSLMEFCQAYKFPMLPTHHALKILEMAGYIEYTEEVDKSSRLIFLARRDDLYKVLRQDVVTDAIIQTILRSYTGLFSDYVYIEESVVASRSGTTPQQVYDTLVSLSKSRIVNYIPQKKTPLIIYTQTREDRKHLVIPRRVYEDRKQRFEKRIDKMLEYMNEDKVCRSRLLLDYFGEKMDADCGLCDVCKEKREEGLSNYEFNTIREALIAQLSDTPRFVKEVIDAIPFPIDKSLIVLRFLADHDDRFTLQDGYVSFLHSNPPPSAL